MDQIKVITLCGSLKFKKEFKATEAALTRKGYAVIRPVFLEQTVTKAEAQLLGTIHYKKIAVADEIFVIDVDGYIGESTQNEIAYAKRSKKIVRYYSEEVIF